MMFVLMLFLLCMRSFVISSHTLELQEDANMTISGSCIQKERQALLVFKASLVDDDDVLDWGSGEDKRNCCKWKGVKCNEHTGQVIELDLSDLHYKYNLSVFYLRLGGKISPSLLELDQLQNLSLSGINFQSEPMPNFLGSLTKLQHLDLSAANLSGPLPHQLANLSDLLHINLSRNALNGSIPDFTGCPSLQKLDLSFNQLSGALPKTVGQLSKLMYLDVSYNSLDGVVSDFHFLNLSDLLHIDLSHNALNGSIPDFTGCPSLQELDLSFNQLSGAFPKTVGQLSKLMYLDVSNNSLDGVISDILFLNLSDLLHIDLSHNAFNGSIPNFTGSSSLSNLILAHNAFDGSIPDFTGCPSLQKLDLSSNQLSGALPKTVGQLSELTYLDVSSNSLDGVVSDIHFLNLTQLTYLGLSFNSLALDLSSHGGIPSQLGTIKLQSCKLGPRFPIWIQTQRNFNYLDISNAGILDSIPAWFWDLTSELKFLNLSSNEIKGTLPDMKLNFTNSYPGIDLSFNNLEGRVPLLSSKLAALNLSGNKFSGTLSFLCQMDGALSFLDLSNNSLSGRLPDCWSRFQATLVVLNLAYNNLTGEIPSSLGLLTHLESLKLLKNSFVGELPVSLSNCINLKFLDLGENKLSGNIPAWIGESLSELYLLILRSNRFYGSLPSQICWLNNLQFFDLSKNGLSGTIPKCFDNFTAMVRSGVSDEITSHSYSLFVGFGRCRLFYTCRRDDDSAPIYTDKTLVAWKGTEREFERGLKRVKSIDLSSNRLSGELPHEITSLVELVSLNLSTNKLHGEVPKQIGQLKSLESLDLSTNKFSGNIPSSMSELTFLGYLNLSNNEFSGRIPLGTQLQSFNASVYSGNAGLYGPPLTPGFTLPPASVVGNEDDGVDFWSSYYIGMGTGFAVGFWGICSVLFLNRRCRHFLFTSLGHLKDWVYVTVVVHLAKLPRKFKRGVLRA